MNVTNCICKYENVTELELKAHIGSPTTKCTKSLFCIFLNSGFQVRMCSTCGSVKEKKSHILPKLHK